MVVGRFRRTLSFPTPNPNSNPSKSYHIRSVSLPCRSHPLIRQLRDEITSLQTWHHQQQQINVNTTSSSSPADHTTTAAWLPDALTRLKTIHDTLDDILQLPQTRDFLASDLITVENLLEDYLRFADVYGNFQSCIISLKEEVLSTQIAIRRRRSDDKSSSSSTSTRSTLTEFVKARKKTGKQLTKLVSTVRGIDRRRRPPVVKEEGRRYHDSNYEELRAVIKQVHDLTVLVSVSLFDGLLLFITNYVGKGSRSWAADLIWCPMKRAIIRMTRVVVVKTSNYNKLLQSSSSKEEALLEKMMDLEDYLCGMEIGSHKVFRTLITTRVSLLNILTTP